MQIDNIEFKPKLLDFYLIKSDIYTTAELANKGVDNI